MALLRISQRPPVSRQHQGNRAGTGQVFCRGLVSRPAGKLAAGLIKTETTFAEAAKKFEQEYAIITEGERSPKWVEGHSIRLRLHLIPFFGKMGLSEINAGTVQDYRVERISTAKNGKAPSRSTLHDEVGTLRQVLKTAIRHKWLSHLPDLSPPYKTQGKISHRPWFSPAEYKQLYEATRLNAKEPKNPHFRWEAEQLHDFVLFMGNTGLRPDEAKQLQHRDVSIVVDPDTRERILEIEVRGKRGIGWCKSMPGAVKPYERLRDRLKARPEREGCRWWSDCRCAARAHRSAVSGQLSQDVQ
ncbi:hypothetical protein ACSV5S_24275 [Agrobacterium deltaense]|uniref:hypothetical protein n=1 Tax=Agrobacterium deltaense TaxID=1183412 RepID=UPI003FD08188